MASLLFLCWPCWHGLGVILVFVGLKMVWLNDAFEGKFPITWSLGIIAAVLTISIAASLANTRRRRLEEISGSGRTGDVLDSRGRGALSAQSARDQ
jgi:hypothetical protein